jgi:hypothetical protein
MSVWDWIDEYASQASHRGDRERLALVEIHPDAYGHRHTDPARMLALLEDGRRRAVALNEPWWVLFFDHWCLETLIYYQDDYRTILDRAVKLTLDLQNPIHDQHPLRFHAYCNLLAAYLCIDPHGYQDAIAAALEYLAGLVPEEGEEKYLLTARCHWFAYEMERLDEALAQCHRLLEHADNDTDRHLALHHSLGAHLSLCRLSLAREDWAGLAGHARAAEDLGERRGAPYDRALAQLWLAVAGCQAGDEETPRRLRSALARFGRLARPLDDNFHDALAAYHELAGDLLKAIAVRTSQLERLQDRGQHATEAEAHLHRLRLKALAGLPLDDDIPPLREILGHLRTPAYYLERLDRLRAGHIPRGILARR